MQLFESDELRHRVDEVLFYIWDPIGVSPTPEARGEYRSYVSRVLEMLTECTDESTIGKYLREIEVGMMALPPNDQRIQAVVELLISHRDAIKDGRA